MRDGCYRSQQQTLAALGPGHPSDWRRLNPCQDSGARVARSAIADAPEARPCPRSCKASGSGAGGMARSCSARAVADVAARCPDGGGPGTDCATAPTCPEGAKEGSRRPGAPAIPGYASQLRLVLRRQGQRCGRGVLSRSADSPRPGARSAPLKLYVEQVLTGRVP